VPLLHVLVAFSKWVEWSPRRCACVTRPWQLWWNGNKTIFNYL